MKKHDVKEALSSIAEWSEKDSKPRGLVQRFWQHFYLRVIVGLFVIAIIVGIGSWYGYTLLYSERLPLVSYVPSDAWMYAEFDIQAEEWVDLADLNEPFVAELNSFFTNHGLDQRVLDVVDRLGLIGIYDPYTESSAWVWIARTKNVSSLELFMQENTFLRQLSDDVVIFSQSEVVRDISRRAQPTFITLQSGGGVLWSGFVRPHERHLDRASMEEGRIDLHALALLSSDAVPSYIPFTVYLTHSGLEISSGDRVGNDIPPTQADIIVEDVDVAQVLSDIDTIFEDLPLPQYHLQRYEDSLNQQYQFDGRGFLSLFQGPLTVMIRNDNTTLLSFTDAIIDQGLFGTEWVVSLNEQMSSDQVSIIKEALKRILAQEDPREITRTLPDGTLSHELMVAPEVYTFVPFDELEQTTRIITSDGEHALYVTITPQGMRVSNSASLLAYAIEYDQTPITCGSNEPAQGVFSEHTLTTIPFLRMAKQLSVSYTKDIFATCINL